MHKNVALHFVSHMPSIGVAYRNYRYQYALTVYTDVISLSIYKHATIVFMVSAAICVHVILLVHTSLILAHNSVTSFLYSEYAVHEINLLRICFTIKSFYRKGINQRAMGEIVTDSE